MNALTTARSLMNARSELLTPMASDAPTVPMAPESPEEPEEVAGKYKAGDKVKCQGGAVGTIDGPGVPEAVYPVKMEDGSVTKQPESTLELSDSASPAEPVEPTAPAELTEVAGVPAGSSMAVTIKAISDLKADRDGMVGDKAKALSGAGVKADMADIADEKLTRASGQTWKQAVDSLKSSRPSLFEAAPTVATSKPAEVLEVKEEKPVAPIVPQAKLPENHEVLGSKGPVATTERKGMVFSGGRFV